MVGKEIKGISSFSIHNVGVHYIIELFKNK